MKTLHALLLLIVSLHSFGSQENTVSEIVDVMDKISNRYYIIDISFPTREEFNKATNFYKNKELKQIFKKDLDYDYSELERAKEITQYIYLNELDNEIIKSGCDFDNLSSQLSYYIFAIEKIKNCLLIDCPKIDLRVGILSEAVRYNKDRFNKCKSKK